jgi:hypothetical protein
MHDVATNLVHLANLAEMSGPVIPTVTSVF